MSVLANPMSCAQHSPRAYLGLLLTSLMISRSCSWLNHHHHQVFLPTRPDPWTTSSSPNTRLHAGDGIAETYSWHEEAFEIEITVPVPQHIRASDIHFNVKSRSIQLEYTDPTLSDERVVLLDPTRSLRGRVQLDGTYWVLSDLVDALPTRNVTVTLEKLLKTPKDDFEVMEYDWKGVYLDDDEEVSYRRYDEPEKLNVREYANSLGVDIDNLNMSMVDKTMFSSQLNLTKSSLDQLTASGMLADEEVTAQADGLEYIFNETTGERQVVDPLGMEKPKKPIPFIDVEPIAAETITPATKKNETVISQSRNFTRAAFAQDAATTTKPKMAAAADPIDVLTVARLKEILKGQGLKTTGNKAELQARVRQQVNSLLQGNQGQAGNDR